MLSNNKVNYIVVILILFSNCVFAESGLRDLEKRINQVVEKKVLIDLQLGRLQDDIHRLESDIRSKRKILIQRTRALGFLKDFKWGGLFAADDPSIFERNLIVMNRLNKYDIELFKEFRQSLRNLSFIRKDLKAKQNEFEKVVFLLKDEELKLLKAENLALQKNRTENKESLLNYKGRLSAPIYRPVQLNYGSKRDSLNQYALFVHGLIFSSKIGDPVQVVGPGRVIFSDHIQHWGDAIIIQHADNYYSVYAGLNRVNKTVNESVLRNEKLAEAGNENFYFELRHFDEPINPKKWFDNNLALKETR